MGIRFAWLLAFAIFASTVDAIAQYRFEPQVYRDWADAANGQPCETQFEGFLAGTAASATYPPAALASRTSGEVLLTFDTRYADETLTIVNARVFASEPAGVFDEAALVAAQNFRFPTMMRNCQGMRANLRFEVNNVNSDHVVRGVVSASLATPPLRPETAQALRDGRVLVHCQIENGVVNPEELGIAVRQLYPRRALERARQGSVVVQFSIAPDGTVFNTRAIEETPPGWEFGSAAAQAMLLARYPIRAEACENAATTVHFFIAN